MGISLDLLRGFRSNPTMLYNSERVSDQKRQATEAGTSRQTNPERKGNFQQQKLFDTEIDNSVSLSLIVTSVRKLAVGGVIVSLHCQYVLACCIYNRFYILLG